MRYIGRCKHVSRQLHHNNYSIINILIVVKLPLYCFTYKLLKSWRSENHTPPPIIIGLTKVNRHTSHENLKKNYFNSSSRNKFFMKLTT